MNNFYMSPHSPQNILAYQPGLFSHHQPHPSTPLDNCLGNWNRFVDWQRYLWSTLPRSYYHHDVGRNNSFPQPGNLEAEMLTQSLPTTATVYPPVQSQELQISSSNNSVNGVASRSITGNLNIQFPYSNAFHGHHSSSDTGNEMMMQQTKLGDEGKVASSATTTAKKSSRSKGRAGCRDKIPKTVKLQSKDISVYAASRLQSPSHSEAAATTEKKRRTSFPKESVEILTKWLKDNWYWAYPTEVEKIELCKQTNMSFVQLDYWFINSRRRLLPDMILENGGDPAYYIQTRKRSYNGVAREKLESDSQPSSTSSTVPRNPSLPLTQCQCHQCLAKTAARPNDGNNGGGIQFEMERSSPKKRQKRILFPGSEEKDSHGQMDTPPSNATENSSDLSQESTAAVASTSSSGSGSSSDTSDCMVQNKYRSLIILAELVSQEYDKIKKTAIKEEEQTSPPNPI